MTFGRKFLFTTFALLLIVAAITSIVLFQQKAHAVISPLAEEEQKKPLFFFFSRKKDPDTLKKTIKELVGNQWNNYSVYVKDFSTGMTVSIDESVIYNAASVNKIPILAALYYEVQNGTIDLSTVITLQQADIQDYGTGSIRYDPPGTTYSLKTLAKLMMQKSDNTAAYILANHTIGLENIQGHLSRWGLTQTDMIDNNTSNKDMAILLEKIYTGNIANQSLTEEMLAFLKDSEFEDRIPLFLPKNAVVYHKIGNGLGNVHDVGIVQQGKLRYYIGMLTSDITDEEKAKELEGKISKTVFDFLQ